MKKRPSGQASLFAIEPNAARPARQPAQREYGQPGLYLGTSSFTAKGWAGSFYPKGLPASEYLAHYAGVFRTVEIDSTFYGTPAATTVAGWYEKTPEDFVFAAKIPQVITHEKVLKNCDAEFEEFLDTIAGLKEKLGPLVFQFPSFGKFDLNRSEFEARLRAFLQRLQGSPLQFVVEIRNQAWLDAAFAALLREHKVCLALTDTSFLPRPWELPQPFDMVTANFVYVRWLGNRKEIEKQTLVWDKTVLDRSDDLLHWVKMFREFVRRELKIYAYANNHYAGNGPGTVKLFWDRWRTG